MAVTNFISTVWSETLLSQLDREYIGVANCNRDFEGDIKGKGSAVQIANIGAINVYDYDKNTDMLAPDTLQTAAVTLTIDQAKSFNFQIDDIDKAQTNPKLMEGAMKQAAAALANVADSYVYGLCKDAIEGNTIACDAVNVDNIIDYVVMARQHLLKSGVNSNIATSLEISPEVAAVLLRAKILNGSENTAALENGLIGKLIGFDVYVSPNVVSADGTYKCLARTKRAVAFAEQLNEVEAYRPETRFADAIKGLHLYGAKIVYPEEFVVLDMSLGE